MIDVSKKSVTERVAISRGELLIKPEVINLIKKNKIPKGDVLATARCAGIMAAKKTFELIPLCHQINTDLIDVSFSLYKDRVIVEAIAKAHAKTGVEMESLVAVSVACLTIYDMCKSMDREMVISNIRLVKKSGGKGGDYVFDEKQNK